MELSVTWIDSPAQSPIGQVYLEAGPEGITRLLFRVDDRYVKRERQRGDAKSEAHLEAAATALAEYFAGARKDFADLRLAAGGTGFQQRVWAALCQIPYGQTESYGGLARRIGRPSAARAVGLANHRNPISIIVPCHRVIGAGGSLTGYAGGLPAKAWLLSHEGAANLGLPLDSPSPAQRTR